MASRTYKALAFTLFGISSLFCAKAIALQIQVSSSEITYSVSHNRATVAFRGANQEDELQVKDCNRSLVEEFFNEFEHARKHDLPVPRRLKGPHMVSLNIDGTPSETGHATKLGLWLRRAPARFRSLVIQAKLACEK